MQQLEWKKTMILLLIGRAGGLFNICQSRSPFSIPLYFLVNYCTYSYLYQWILIKRISQLYIASDSSNTYKHNSFEYTLKFWASLLIPKVIKMLLTSSNSRVFYWHHSTGHSMLYILVCSTREANVIQSLQYLYSAINFRKRSFKNCSLNMHCVKGFAYHLNVLCSSQGW